MCLLDISKCFDSINYEILLKKLEMYGFQDVELTCFKSYLYNRQHLVSFRQETSEYLDIKNGVPQGSVLGPILFLLLDWNPRVFMKTGLKQNSWLLGLSWISCRIPASSHVPCVVQE